MAALRFVFCELFRGNLVLIVRPVVKPTCLCSSEYKRCLLLGHAAPSLLLSVRTAGMQGTCGLNWERLQCELAQDPGKAGPITSQPGSSGGGATAMPMPMPAPSPTSPTGELVEIMS